MGPHVRSTRHGARNLEEVRMLQYNALRFLLTIYLNLDVLQQGTKLRFFIVAVQRRSIKEQSEHAAPANKYESVHL